MSNPSRPVEQTPAAPPIAVGTTSPAPSPPIHTSSPAPSPPIHTSSPAPSPPIHTSSPAPSPAHNHFYISSAPSSPYQEGTEEAFDIAVALRSLQSRVHHLAPTANQINVLRNEEFECAERAFRRPAFNPQSKLDIVFIDEDGQGEGAIDDGGPTREFSLHNNTYRLVGQMLAVCLIHGGVSPHFFSKRLFNQVCGLPPSPATIEEVVDHSLRAKLEKISSAVALQDARQAVNEAAEELAMMGALRHLRSLDHRGELMEAVLQFHCEGRIYAALQQFKEGLTSLGVLDEVTSHPQDFEKVFLQDTTTLKASDIVGVFQARCRSLHQIGGGWKPGPLYSGKTGSWRWKVDLLDQSHWSRS
ncbi:G2/M phase-specific E3 ubiquitin-protein ligase-like isoform X2 [Micropterus dolomieu]|uniref:G2/M phase-specific E3 ubiquitin-protein ligase-like isoform X2 n=1 Tax=Micropterus dolomieu TaxID=147949 RepID=UPI001E8CA627|nr:G2/M phase-specific E3 ubiquitin-protein ligase-like isoform X2 [Micropterus dolomieu]